MQNLVAVLSNRPEGAGFLIFFLLKLATGLGILLAIVRGVRILDEEIRALKASELWNSVVAGLYSLFCWPAFKLTQQRRMDRARSGDAVLLFLGSLLGFLLYIGVAVALIYQGEGLARPFEENLAGILFLVTAIAFARASMISATKHWYGIL